MHYLALLLLISPWKQIETKRRISTSTRIKIISFRDAIASATSRLQCQVEVKVNTSTWSTNKMQFLLHRSWCKWFGYNLVPRLSLLLLQRQQREGRETLGMRLIWPDIRPTCACASFCFHVHYFDASTGAGIKRKKKKLCLALRLL